MKLAELERFESITIQCHDNPDADTIAAGYALYSFFKEKKKKVQLIYGGKNKIQKANLVLLKDKLAIPILHTSQMEYTLTNYYPRVEGLLVTVDCQYRAGNVSYIEADEIAIIDHHQMETSRVELEEIDSTVGSCSTLVWKMMKEEAFQFQERTDISTALYYGLYTDSGQFSEIYNPLDMDMRDTLRVDKRLIRLLKNTNLSRRELETAGIALIRNNYNEKYQYSIIHSEPCDPNILGIISDFLLQVDDIHSCVVFNEINGGYKISVRSCIKEVNASELVRFLCQGIGSGGGHREKAGGFIVKRKYEQIYPDQDPDRFFKDRMNLYFEDTDIFVGDQTLEMIHNMIPYRQKAIPAGYVRGEDLFPTGTGVTIRSVDGDMEMKLGKGLHFLIGQKGEAIPYTKEKFQKYYLPVEGAFQPGIHTVVNAYVSTVRSRHSGEIISLSQKAELCIPRGDYMIHGMELKKRTKLFSDHKSEGYMTGNPGDFLAIRNEKDKDFFIMERNLFLKAYEKI